MISNCVVSDYWKIYVSVVIHLPIIFASCSLAMIDKIGILFPVYYACPNKIMRNLLQRPLFSVLCNVVNAWYFLSFLDPSLVKSFARSYSIILNLSVLVFHSGGMSSAQSALLLWNEWCSKEWRSSLLEMSGAPTFAPLKWIALILYSLLWSEREK